MFTHYYLFFSFPLFLSGVLLILWAFSRLKENAPIYRSYYSQIRNMDSLQLTAQKIQRAKPKDREFKSAANFYKKQFDKFKTNTTDQREELTQSVLFYFVMMLGGIAAVAVSVCWCLTMYINQLN